MMNRFGNNPENLHSLVERMRERQSCHNEKQFGKGYKAGEWWVLYSANDRDRDRIASYNSREDGFDLTNVASEGPDYPTQPREIFFHIVRPNEYQNGTCSVEEFWAELLGDDSLSDSQEPDFVYGFLIAVWAVSERVVDKMLNSRL